MTTPYGHRQGVGLSDGTWSLDKTPGETGVRVASTANLADAVSVVIDGVTCVAGDRVLRKNQTDPIENGVYAFGEVSAGTASLERVSPVAVGDRVYPGLKVYVAAGTDNGGKYFFLNNATIPTIGTDALTFAEISSASGAFTAADVEIADAGTLYTATDVEGALAEAKTLIDAGMPVQKKTVTATHATLVAAAATETVNIGTALPANSRIVGVDFHTLTVFSGGTVSDFTVDVGTAGDVDALIDGADLFAAAVDGGPATIPQGIRPNKFFAAGGQLIATFRCASDDVADASAGAVTVDVLYVVLP